MTNEKTILIRRLNDALRWTFITGRVMITSGVSSQNAQIKSQIIKAVQEYDKFTEDNDPYGEHDFGDFVVDGTKYFWKIDYYDSKYSGGSEDPSDESITNRVLTIMRADEY
jgi:hypothetical protein